MLPRFIDQSPWAAARHLLIKTTYWPPMEMVSTTPRTALSELED